jgi:hypothetical protein
MNLKKTALSFFFVVAIGIGLGFLIRVASSRAERAPMSNTKIDKADRPPRPTLRDALQAYSTKRPEESRKDRSSSIAPPSVYHPRDPKEWQGMLVDLTVMPPCVVSSDCGLAMACQGGKCGPCEIDAECARGEVCVLDHCVMEGKATCRSVKDCQEDELCILSGYDATPRSNQEMRSYCNPNTGGREEKPEDAAKESSMDGLVPAAEKPEVDIDELRKRLDDVK